MRIDDLKEQIAEEGFPVPRIRLSASPWSLEPPAVDALMEKIRRVGVPLKDFAGVKPYRGVLTGFNEAFLIDTSTRDALLKADSKCADVIKRYVRGQDINRWHPDWAGLWMIAMKSSGDYQWPWAGAGDRAEEIFASTFPAIHAHLNGFREELHNRQDQGHNWWELRSCAYWDEFEKPKVMYGEITWRAEWAFDLKKTYSNNTVYILPTEDFWTLAVGNSPVTWWYSWRTAIHGKDEALRFIRDFTEGLPIPKPNQRQSDEASVIVRRLIEIAEKQQQGLRDVLDWLRIEYAIDKPTQKLANILELDADALIAEVKKIRGKKNPLSVAGLKSLREEHARTIAPARSLAAEALHLERQLGDLVNEAYGLTPEEVALMWKTAPPRMPYTEQGAR